MVLTSISLISDLVWLITGHPGKLAAIFAIVLLFVKAAGVWFAYDVFRSTDGGKGGRRCRRAGEGRARRAGRVAWA